jgi:pilus assembly protein CpaC
VHHHKHAPGEHVLGTTPKPTPKTAEKIDKYIGPFIDPEANLVLISGQTRLLTLKETPKRIQVANESVFTYELIGKDQLIMQGRMVGNSSMTFWFPDQKDATKEEILTYYVRVLPDPEERERLERHYKTLQDQVNCAFPDSVICLHLVGDKLVVTGEAKDIAEAAQIMRIVRSNVRGYGNTTNPAREQRMAQRIPTDRPSADRLPDDPTEDPGDELTPGDDNYVLRTDNLVVNMLRIPGEQQVQLHVIVAEVNRLCTRSIGVNWTILNDEGTAVFAQATGNIATAGLAQGNGFGVSAALSGAQFVPSIPGIAAGAGGFNNLPASLDNGQVRLAISALRNINYAKYLAQQSIVTVNGKPGTFRAGGEYPLPVIANSLGGGASLQGVEFQPYGVSVSFTPYITDRDRIRLQLQASISAISNTGGSSNIGGSQVPNFNQRSFSNVIELRDGQTLAVAGLIQADWTGHGSRVPLFGDLPVIGRLASFDRVSAGEQELVMLVTADLVHPLDKKQRPGLPGMDIYEPTDIEFYLLGRLESHGQVDFRSPVRTDWQRLRDYRHMETTYITGPSGHTLP